MRAFIVVVVLVSACAPKPNDPQGDGGQASMDAAVPLDGGQVQDASAPPDAASVADAATARDASVVPDAAVVPDASVVPDAAVAPDAAVVVPPSQMLLHAEGGQLTHLDGRAVDFRGAISCCMGGNFGWPLFNEAWVDHVTAFSVNFLHLRLGPFLTGVNGESDWAATGGPYAEVSGKADLSTWNEVFWTRVRELLAYAHDRGLYVEVDLADGWAIKHCQWGDIPGYSAWDSATNLQGEDVCGTAGNAPVMAGSRHDAWLRKVVMETGGFDNVIFQDGNEIGLVRNYSAAWTTSMEAVVRDVETQQGYARHLFGTQSGDSDAMASSAVEFLEFHQDNPLNEASCLGKPCLVNEYNPDPPMTASELHDRYCHARSHGSYFWYWRHGQENAVMDETLRLIGQGCG